MTIKVEQEGRSSSLLLLLLLLLLSFLVLLLGHVCDVLLVDEKETRERKKEHVRVTHTGEMSKTNRGGEDREHFRT